MSAYTLPIGRLFDRLTDLLIEFEKVGMNYAEARGTYESIDDQKKPYLSILSEQTEGSQALKESKAYSHPKWQEYLNKLSAARLEYYKAQSKYELIKTKIDALRTLISTRKEEIKKFEG